MNISREESTPCNTHEWCWRWGRSGVAEIKPGSALCKASALTPVLSYLSAPSFRNLILFLVQLPLDFFSVCFYFPRPCPVAFTYLVLGIAEIHVHVVSVSKKGFLRSLYSSLFLASAAMLLSVFGSLWSLEVLCHPSNCSRWSLEGIVAISKPQWVLFLSLSWALYFGSFLLQHSKTKVCHLIIITPQGLSVSWAFQRSHIFF